MRNKNLNPINEIEEEIILENNLRPKGFDEFIGQQKIVDNLKVFISACLKRGDSLDHVLLTGPPGLGKTTLSNIIAHELGVNIKITSGPVLEKPGDLAGILTNLEPHSVLFIDEIHRLNSVVEEYLYSAMEDFIIDIVIDSGPNARTVQIKLPKFTLVGATTRAGLLTAPLRDRFGIKIKLDYYTPDILQKIVTRSANILNIKIEEKAALEIAKRSRGTPRIANRLLKRTRDFADYQNKSKIDVEIAKYALNALEIDEDGLDDMDKQILLTLIDKFKGRPVGLKSLAIAVNEDPGTLEEVYEPYLIQKGLLIRTPRGREATELAYKKFNINISKDNFFFEA
ncbi:MAG TPA: Holliday junction branch migration DNA helicase RuvB [Ignavibacteriales bacterium]|jgi:Holliday junction DNA helicase RuvB|nr:Holliday junction branch migration DNA helicase RuvB [Ignavibacteriales bacterium]